MRGIRWILLLSGAFLPLAVLAQSGATQGGTSATPASTADAAAPTFAEAKALAEKGRLDQALVELNELAKVEPEEAGVEQLRGDILYQREQLPLALAAFTRAVSEDPADRESMEMEGITLYRLGKPMEAIPLLEKADTTAKGANADPHYVLGLCYADAKRYDDARRAFAAQFGFPVDSAEAYLVTARLLLRREFVEQAAAFARKATEINPAIPTAHQLLGEIALAKANVPQAVMELKAEQKLNPVDGVIYDRLGDAYVRTGEFAKARDALNKAILLEPNATGPYILLGEALIELGQPSQAVHYLDHAAGMDPGNYITHNFLGQAYRALGRQADSVREFKRAVELQHGSDPKPERVK